MKILSFSLIVACLFLFSPQSQGQSSPLAIAWQAPVGPDAAYGYDSTTCDNTPIGCLNCPPVSLGPPEVWPTKFQCFLSTVLPNVSGVGFVIPWGEIDNCSTTTSCKPDNTCTSNCFNWSYIDNALMDFIHGPVGSGKSWTNGCAGSRPCKIVLIVWLTTDSGNTNLFNNVPNTPKYVFTSAYASSLSSAPQDVVVCRDWQGTNGPSVPWGGTSPITDSCWAAGKDDVGLWNATGPAHILKNPGCMQTNPITTNFSGYPVMYETPIFTAATNFISALALHYSSACAYTSCGNGPTIAKSIAYMRIGPSGGGENTPHCACESSTGGSQCDTSFWPGPQGYSMGSYSDQGYLTQWPGGGLGYVASLYNYIQQQNWAFPIDTPTEKGPPMNSNLSYPDIEASLANQYGLGMGMQAASIGDTVTYATQATPSTAANWAVHFREFPNVPDHHLQTAGPGSPQQAGQFTIGNITPAGLISCTGDCSVFCNSPWAYITGTSIQAYNGIWATIPGNWETVQSGGCTMNTIQLQSPPSGFGTSSGGVVYSAAHLPLLLPFEIQNCRGSFRTICSAELWEETLDWAYGTNTVSNTIGNSPSGDQAYQNAISNFLVGLPDATSMHNHMSTNAKHY